MATKWYNSNWFRALEFVAIILGIIGISIDVFWRFYYDRVIAEESLEEFQRSAIQFKVTQEELRKTRLEGAYAVFKDRSHTRQRRIQAANLLLSENTLGLVDFSCSQFNSGCSSSPPVYTWVKREGELGIIKDGDLNAFYGLKLSGVELDQWELQNIGFNDITLTNAKFSTDEWENVVFRCSDLTNAKITASTKFDVRFVNTNVSELKIKLDFILEKDTDYFHGTYFFEGHPPQLNSLRDMSVDGVEKNTSRAKSLGALLIKEGSSVPECPGFGG